MYAYLKALHIIFVVTWFAGMFYIVRLFIYNTEAAGKAEPEKSILQKQFSIMIKRLWFGITWPSAVLTLIFGPLVMLNGNWHKTLGNEVATIFLVAIVMLAAVKSSLSWVWGLAGLLSFIIVLMSAIKVYKAIRSK